VAWKSSTFKVTDNLYGQQSYIATAGLLIRSL